MPKTNSIKTASVFPAETAICRPTVAGRAGRFNTSDCDSTRFPEAYTAEARLAERIPELTAMLVRMGFPHHEAEDASQDAMLVALRYRQSGKDRTVKNPRTWLRAVAVRAACKGLLKRLPCDAVAVGSVAAGEDPCDEAARRDEAAVLLSAVRELPDGPRQVLEFCTLGGHTYGEAALRFGACPGVVGRRLRVARDALRSRLEGLGFDSAT